MEGSALLESKGKKNFEPTVRRPRLQTYRIHEGYRRGGNSKLSDRGHRRRGWGMAHLPSSGASPDWYPPSLEPLLLHQCKFCGCIPISWKRPSQVIVSITRENELEGYGYFRRYIRNTILL